MNRWYTQLGVTKITTTDAKEFGVTKIEEKTQYYQYCYSLPLKQDEKFSLEFFDKKAQTDASRQHSLYQVLEHLYFSEGGKREYASSKDKKKNIFTSSKFLALLKKNYPDATLLTKKFHIPPGKAETDQGGQVLLQVIVGITPTLSAEFVKFLDTTQPLWNTDAVLSQPTAKGTVKDLDSRIFHVSYEQNITQLEELKTAFLKMDQQNQLLKQGYAYDFKELSNQCHSLIKLLANEYSTRVLKGEFYSGILAAALGRTTKGETPLQYVMQYSFVRKDKRIFIKEPPQLFFNKKIIFSLDERYFPSMDEDNSKLPVFSDDFVAILYKLAAVYQFTQTANNKSIVKEFVEKFLDPKPGLLTPRRQAIAVYNNADAKTKHKTPMDLERERLSELTKLEVFRSVKDKYNQVGDQAFIHIIQDYKEINTIEDVYKKVLHVVPLDNLIEEATTCLLKQLPNTNYKKIVCDVILGDLTLSDMDKVLNYLNTLTAEGATYLTKAGATPEEASEFKQTVTIDKTQFKKAEVQRVKNQLNQFIEKRDSFDAETRTSIITYVNNDLEARDVLCAAILAVVPAAIYLFSRLTSSPGDVSDLIPPLKLVNPAKDYLDQLTEAFSKIKTTSLTDDWAQALNAVVLAFIGAFVVKAVQAVLEQIAQMCEGTSESDFAGMGELPGEGIPPSVNATFPFSPFAIRDLVNASTTEEPYESLGNSLGVSAELMQDFLDDLSTFLTVSEICSLLSEDGNKSYIIQKMWNGILQRAKYAPIRKALNSQPKIVQFFFVLSQNVSQAACVKKIENLERTKKFLSDLCGPSKNEALLNDLKNKATADALADLLNQQDEMARNVLSAITNLSEGERLATKAPPLFCGPETTESKNPQAPVFASQTHPSQEYIGNLFTTGLLDTLQKKFEEELQFYKPILSQNNGSEAIAASMAATNIIGSLYSFKEGSTPKNLKKGGVKELSLETGLSSQVAPQVVQVLNNLQTGVTTVTEAGYISIDTEDSIDGEDRVGLKLNFKTGTVQGVPGKTVRLNFGIDSSYDKNIEGTAIPYTTLANNVFTDPDTGGVNKDNSYENKIFYDVLWDESFYAQLLDQIVKEHAEYISDEDLFNRKTFDSFPLIQKNPQCKSLLDSPEMSADAANNAKALQCQKNFGAVPSPKEIADINSYVEMTVKIITIQEYLKCLLVFGTFGIDALLPVNAAEEKSFFFRYMQGQVSSFLEDEAKGWGDVLNQYSRQVYAAIENKTYGEVSKEETLEWIFTRQFKSIRAAFAKKLDAIGLNKNNTLSTEFLNAEPPSYQVIKNLFARNGSAGYFDPPKVLNIDFKEKYFTVEEGFYTDNPRLKNGGFFVEYGFEAMPKFKGDQGAGDFIDSALDKINTGGVFSSNNQLSALLGYKSPTGRPFDYTLQEFVAGYKANQTLSEHWATLEPLNSETNWPDSLEYMGKLSLADYNSNYNLSFEQATQTLNTFSPEAFGSPLFTTPEVESILTGNKLYNDYNFYYSFNLLLPVNSEADKKRYQELFDATNDAKYDTGFFQSVLHRRMFIREGEDGQLFFKLPILIKKELNESNTLASQLNTASGFYPTASGVNVYNTSTGQGLLSKISQTEQFTEFENSIFYKDLLSFLAILTAEATEQRYPALLNLFPQTLATVEGILSNKLRVANRDSDPDFYKQIKLPSASLNTVAPDFDKFYLIVLRTLVEAGANVTDPTWRTPWLLPGPLTPVGVIAKLMNQFSGGDNDITDSNTDKLQNKVQEAIKEKQKEGAKDSFECEDGKT